MPSAYGMLTETVGCRLVGPTPPTPTGFGYADGGSGTPTGRRRRLFVIQTCHCIPKSNEIPYLLALPSSLLAGSFCYLGLRMLALFSYACLSRLNFRFLAPLSGRGMYGHETQRSGSMHAGPLLIRPA